MNVWDLIVRVAGNGRDFRDDMRQNKAEVDEFHADLDALPNEKVVKIKTETDKGANGGGLLAGTILTALPALTPLLAAATAGTMGLASAFVSAGSGAAGLAAVAIPTIKDIFDAQKQLTQAQQAYNTATTSAQRQQALQQEKEAWAALNVEQQQAVKSLQSFSTFWHGFVQSFQTPVLSMFSNGLGMLQTLLTDLAPTITAAANAFTYLEQDAKDALGSPFWKQFFDYLSGSANLAILDFSLAIGNLIHGFAALMMAFDPLSKSMSIGLVNLTQRFADWAENLSKTQGFQNFINYVRTTGPQVLQLIGNLATTVGLLLKAMAPAGAILLQVVNAGLRMINWLLTLNPLVGQFAVAIMQGIGVMKLLGPVLTSVGGPWGILIAAIVAGAVLIISHWSQVKAVALEVWHAIMSVVREVWSFIGPYIMGAVNAIADFWRSIWPELKQLFVGVWDVMKTYLGPIFALWQAEFSLISTVLKAIWKPFWETLLSFLKFVWDSIVGTIKLGWDIITGLFKIVLDILTGNWSKAWEDMKALLGNVWNDITGMFSKMADDALKFGENFVHMIANGIMAGVHWVEDAVSNVASKIKSFLGFSSPTEEGPGSKADKWMPNMMNMFVDGIHTSTPKLHAALNQVLVPPNVAGMMQAGQSLGRAAASVIQQGGHTVQVIVNGPVYGVDDFQAMVKGAVEDHALPALLQQLKPTARAMGVGR